ncbi:MAG: alpha/beta hydrolase domain-containing protein [Acidimicrobiales bacterium]
MHRRSVTSALAILSLLALLAAACSDDTGDAGDTTDPSDGSTTTFGPAATTTTTDAVAEPPSPADDLIGDPVPTPNPEVRLPPDAGSTFYQGVGFDLSLVGYEQSEYFLTGTARSFAPVGELTPDGRWVVEAADEADYTTRIVVVRPSDPADFNGTVMMEWFNVSGGLDAAPNFTMSHVEQLREGYAYVGVSAQERGIEGGGGGVDVGFPIHLKGAEPERYAPLQHPGDSFSYDIFSQAAQAVRNPGDSIDPLGGLPLQHVIAVGESQSAFRLTTYVNAIDPVAQLFDGFLIHSRGGGSADLSQGPQAESPTPEQVLIRDDVRVPVLTFQTDSDLLLLGWVPDRQPDSDNFVLWEVAGTAHGDVYSISLDVGPQDLGNDPAIAAVVEVASPIPGIMDCGGPINSGPQHYVMNAAVHALARWAAGGEPPTSAPRAEVVEVEVDPDAEGRQATHAPVTDDYGNILGGVRTAWVDVPVARLTGEPVGGSSFCGLFGSTTLFDDATLAELYPTKAAYLDAMTASIDQSVADGFLRPLDAELILQYAADNDIGL